MHTQYIMKLRTYCIFSPSQSILTRKMCMASVQSHQIWQPQSMRSRLQAHPINLSEWKKVPGILKLTFVTKVANHIFIIPHKDRYCLSFWFCYIFRKNAGLYLPSLDVCETPNGTDSQVVESVGLFLLIQYQVLNNQICAALLPWQKCSLEKKLAT